VAHRHIMFAVASKYGFVSSLSLSRYEIKQNLDVICQLHCCAYINCITLAFIVVYPLIAFLLFVCFACMLYLYDVCFCAAFLCVIKTPFQSTGSLLVTIQKKLKVHSAEMQVLIPDLLNLKLIAFDIVSRTITVPNFKSFRSGAFVLSC